MIDAFSKFSLAHPWLSTYIALIVVKETHHTARRFFSLFQKAPTAVAIVPTGSHEFTVTGDTDKGKTLAQLFLDKAMYKSDGSYSFAWKVSVL